MSVENPLTSVRTVCAQNASRVVISKYKKKKKKEVVKGGVSDAVEHGSCFVQVP